MKNFYITTPIYYVNSNLHLGHAYTTILADVITGYHKLQNGPTWFLTGVDEHGLKVLSAARVEGSTPQEHCDRMAVRFQDLWRKLEVGHDRFIRTTEPVHKKVVREIMQRLYDQGDIYQSEYEGWYCVSDERFFTDKDVPEQICPECGKPLTRLAEKNYFFRMSRYQEWLIKHIRDNPEFILPVTRRNEILGFLKNPLEDLCISRVRSKMEWGIPLPFDEEYVTYVWFDALLNYLTGTGYSVDNDQYEKTWPADIHLIGKDILTTHAVYWPTMLQAAGLTQPEHIIAHGWWLTGDRKMAKSEGNVVDPLALVDYVGVEPFRYFLIRGIVPWNDASFTPETLVHTCNTDLANDLGNLLSRVTNLVKKFFDNRVPELTEPYEPFVSALATLHDRFHEYVRQADIYHLVDDLMGIIREANRYMEQQAPWKLAKTDTSAAGNVLANVLEVLRQTSGYLQPIMPQKCRILRERIGAGEVDDFDTFFRFGQLAAGTAVTHGEPLFPRLEAPPKNAPQAEESPAEGIKLIGFDDFSRIQLITARIEQVVKVENAARLLQLKLDDGRSGRQIVAGIAEHYQPGDLVGRTVILVANLEPATIRGVRSEGMLLAAKSGSELALITPDQQIPPGTPVG